jgi:hypothetical protein
MFTFSDFEDLVQIIDEHPEWRMRLKRAIFPETDLEIALRELAESRKYLESVVAKLLIGQDVLKQDMAEVKQDISGLKRDMGTMQKDVRDLKGNSHEEYYRQRAEAIFGRYIRNGRNATSQVADKLYEGMKADVLSENELDQVLAADLLWSGETREERKSVLLVLEASWRAEMNDVLRAVQRADILKRIGYAALPMVAGRQWDDVALEQAVVQGVVTTQNGHIDRDSWNRAVKLL